MSKLSNAVSKMNENNLLRKNEVVTNFMGGDSYRINPIDTLKMVAASSIFGEPSYYRTNVRDSRFFLREEFSDEFARKLFKNFDNKTTTEIFTETIDNALDYDFKSTLDLAVELRTVYNMRLNPQIIMVRASIHPKRIEFTNNNPGLFNEYEQKVMSRADEPITQLTYYMYINEGKKNNLPTILKKSIANKLSSLSRYQVNKYKNHEIGMINAVRISHANSKVLNELMKNGNVEIDETETTWEQLRSSGKTWVEILDKIDLGHMALLRNLRNIFTEIDNFEFCKKVMEQLKSGVLNGKQFPFRYYTAYQMIEKSDVNHKQLILDTLEECVDIACDNMPKLKGKTICLSDNSGSAWGGFNSEYGSVTVADIDNLSSLITSKCSDEGVVGKFGDTIKYYPTSQRNGTLSQLKQMSNSKGNDVGMSTEGGIWEFFKDSIDNGKWYDNIFIYSDQQAGTGGLYGTRKHKVQYCKNYGVNGEYINVFKLVQEYRKSVNPKVNVFSIQTAGYDNILIPQMSYRCAMLTGWTGKESLFASEYIKQWDNIENR